jgi:hypothetical protein
MFEQNNGTALQVQKNNKPDAAQFQNPAILVKVKIHQELPCVRIFPSQSRTDSTIPVWSEYSILIHA